MLVSPGLPRPLSRGRPGNEVISTLLDGLTMYCERPKGEEEPGR